MQDLDQFKLIYFQECDELLGAMEEHLMALEEGSSEPDTLHAIFRAVHSIKGGAGAFGFERLVGFAHTFETALDLLREGTIPATSDVVGLLLRAGDKLSDLVGAARSGQDIAAGAELEVLGQLQALIEGGGGAVSASAPASAEAAPVEEAAEEPEIDLGGWTPVAVDLDEPLEDEVLAGERPFATWRVAFKPSPDMFAHGSEPVVLIRELKNIGTLQPECDLSRLPALADLDPGQAYLSWDCKFETQSSADEIRDIFAFAVDDCELTVELDIDLVVPEAAPAPAAKPAAKAEPAPVPATPAAPEAAPAAVAAAAPSPADKPKAAAPAAAAAQGGAGAAVPPTIRVDLERVDKLVDMVGELVITQAMLSQQASGIPLEEYPALFEGLDQLQHHMRELQESVMGIRAQPVKSVFARMPRLVRELAAATNKEIRLITEGENTEIDKTVIERLSDPLTHMIRNSCDHGVETPEERVAAGKPREGTIILRAEHRGGRIVIEVADDGRGINRERVLQKAIDKGLVAANAQLSDEEIDNLIFLPGFSTAEKVSDISGRGVGMDVVRRNIQDVGGRIVITSTPGQGSCFTLTLPLTLAVMDGMVVVVGGHTYILPISNIIESLRPRPSDLHHLAGRGDLLQIRGEYVELIYLHDVFGIQGAVHDPSKGIVVLVETEDAKVGLIVDDLLGQQQVVIKSLEENFDRVEGVAAATILGDGRVALILDTDGLRTMSKQRPYRRHNWHPTSIVPDDAMIEELT